MSKPLAIGIDVGGTKIAVGLINRAGTILHRYTSRAHAEQQPAVVIAAIEDAYYQLVQQSGVDIHSVVGVGIGFPGNTNGAAGIVLSSSNLPAWDHYPLRDTLTERLGLPVTLDNDCNMAALAEHRYGAGRGTQHMIYVTLSTGYGAGIILNGNLYAGASGTAGEIGHAVVEVNGPLCSCGKRGCLMAYASGIGISRMVYEALATGATTTLRNQLPANGQRWAAEVVAAAAQAGDAVATEIIQRAGYYGGIGLSWIVEALNPELIVIGGGLTHIGSLLLEPLHQALRQHTQPELWASVQVKQAELTNDLGIVGAAAQVFQHFSSE